MFTIKELLEYKEKAEAELVMARARVSVADELIEMAGQDDQVQIEDADEEEIAEDHETDGNF